MRAVQHDKHFVTSVAVALNGDINQCLTHIINLDRYNYYYT